METLKLALFFVIFLSVPCVSWGEMTPEKREEAVSRCNGNWGWGYVKGSAFGPSPNSKAFPTKAGCKTARDDDSDAQKVYGCSEFCDGKFDSAPRCTGNFLWGYFVGVQLMSGISPVAYPNSEKKFETSQQCEAARRKDKKAVDLQCDKVCDGELKHWHR